MIPRDYEEPVSFWEWVRSQLLVMIPGVGLVMMFYWAFSSGTKTSKRNFFRAQLFFVTPLMILGVGLLSAAAIPAFQKVRASALAKLEANSRPQTESTSQTEPESPFPAGAGAQPVAATDATPASSPASSSEKAALSPAAEPSAPPTLTPNEPTRSLRSVDGRVIEARVVSLTDDEVTIMRVNGQEFTVEMSRFSAEDVAYFMRLRHGKNAFE